jgi:LPXTG-motif cell wall-anchored protein
MNSSKAGGAAFLAVGIVFIVIGSSGQRAYIAIGAAFILIGLIFMARRRAGGPR